MFTGIIQFQGSIRGRRSIAEGVEFSVEAPALTELLAVDDSVAINGVCTTVIKKDARQFVVQAVHVTLEKTTMGSLRIGELVNLEPAMSLGDRIGGHLMQGHIGAMAKVLKITNQGENYEVWFKLPADQMKYVVKEGSIAVNGISLTVADRNPHDNSFMVTLIPHTWKNTNLSKIKVGTQINIEVDIMAKQLEQLLGPYLANLPTKGPLEILADKL